MSAGCCGDSADFTGISADYRRRLWLVIAINAGMFAVEMAAGRQAMSQALQADALDFLGDALTYGLSLAVIGLSLRVRASAALAKGLSLLVMGGFVLTTTLQAVLADIVPTASTMGAVGFLALAANLTSVVLLMRYRDGDSNVRSVWLCSRNDAIGNVAVMVAALGVWGSATHWPDLAVAGIMACLFTWSALQIIRQSVTELRTAAHAEPPCI